MTGTLLNDDSERLDFTADADARRFDVFLHERMEGWSRAGVQRLIESGAALLNGALAKAGSRVRAGDTVAITVPPVREIDAAPEPLPLDILHEDEHIIVVNKRVGMSVHPAPGHATGTLVNALLYHCRNLSGIGGAARPGIVHRLDKETSGVIVVAKNDVAHLSLTSQFAARQVEKLYFAVAHGAPERRKFVIDAPIGRSPSDRKKMAVVTRGGREARTEFERLETLGAFSTMAARPRTGRTHQIRVHAAHAGHPVAGDSVYGGRRARGAAGTELLIGHALHAARLEFTHPAGGARAAFEAPLREDIKAFVGFLKGGSGER